MKIQSLFLVFAAMTVASSSFARAGASPEPTEWRLIPNEQQLVETSQLVLDLENPESLPQILMSNGLSLVRWSVSVPGRAIVQAGSIESAGTALDRLSKDRRINAAYRVHRTFVQPQAFVSNDPFFPILSTTVGQWHLRNTVTAGLDVDVLPAWNADVTGNGVLIGVVDDGVQGSHPDLQPNFDLANSFDFVNRDQDPAPEGTDRHGTSVAGVSAARGGNGIGVTGAAPLARVSGQRLGFSGVSTDADFADAVLYRSSGSNTSIKIKNHSYGYTTPYVVDTLNLNAARTSSAAGTIHAYAAGNDRGTRGQDANKKPVINDPSVIAVAALGSNGIFASYSNFGSNIFVTAPSSSSGLRGITTTDVTGSGGYNGISTDTNYTNAFGGTSSATPLVVGVLALAEEVNPAAEVRIMKHNLARTSRVVDANDNTNDGGWRTNSAGLRFNTNYGFGIIDAQALVDASRIYVAATPRVTFDSGTITVGQAIPDGTGSLSRSFNVTGSGRVEDVQVDLNITHPDRGDYSINLTSPSGLTVRLAIASGSDTFAAIPWSYLANAFWGESATGTWTVQIADATAGGAGTLNNWRLRVNTGQRMARKTIGGTINVDQFGASYAATTARVELYNPGQTTSPVSAATGTLSASGALTVQPIVVDGTYDVVVKAGTGLAKRFSNVNMNGLHSFPTALNVTLINGDVDDDNEVSILDYIRLSDSYGLLSNESGFDDRADLDGDDAVSILDYIILSTSYGLQGE